MLEQSVGPAPGFPTRSHARSKGDYRAVMPPSITSSEPVTKADSSLAR